VTTEQTFDDFQHHPFDAEARQRWGDDAVDGAHARIGDWSPQDAERARTGYRSVHLGLAGLLAAGIAVDDDRVQQLIDEHYHVTSLFWTPTRQAYLGLAQTYQDDERFAHTIGGDNPACKTLPLSITILRGPVSAALAEIVPMASGTATYTYYGDEAGQQMIFQSPTINVAAGAVTQLTTNDETARKIRRIDISVPDQTIQLTRLLLSPPNP